MYISSEDPVPLQVLGGEEGFEVVVGLLDLEGEGGYDGEEGFEAGFFL